MSFNSDIRKIVQPQWFALETINYFLKNGSEVFICLMDMTKAFDNVKHSILFRKLLDQGLPVIFIRLLLFMYKHQKANVRWGSSIMVRYFLQFYTASTAMNYFKFLERKGLVVGYRVNFMEQWDMRMII